MTPYILLDQLATIMQSVLENVRPLNGKAFQVFTQNPPPRLEENYDIFPYCLIRLGDGKDSDLESTQNVAMIFGVDGGLNDYEGYRDVLNCIQSAREQFARQPYFGSFRVKKPVEWALPDDESSYPQYFGALLLTVIIPQIENVEEEFVWQQ